jgi:hypothetical protein
MHSGSRPRIIHRPASGPYVEEITVHLAAWPLPGGMLLHETRLPVAPRVFGPLHRVGRLQKRLSADPPRAWCPRASPVSRSLGDPWLLLTGPLPTSGAKPMPISTDTGANVFPSVKGQSGFFRSRIPNNCAVTHYFYRNSFCCSSLRFRSFCRNYFTFCGLAMRAANCEVEVCKLPV